MALSERQRRTLERRLRDALAEAWRDVDDELADALTARLDVAAVPAGFWDRLAASGIGAVVPLLIETYLSSARRLADAKLPAEITVRWDLINTRAQRWAERYSFELVKGITATSRDRLRELVSAYAAQPETDLRTLGQDIGRIFGPARGNMIATTEVTRAAAQGEMGLAAEIRRDNPRLRVVEIWLTSQDELVCPVCGPLHGKARGDGWTDPPPAHPRCRCAVSTDFVLP